jgi:hypothetical protein
LVNGTRKDGNLCDDHNAFSNFFRHSRKKKLKKQSFFAKEMIKYKGSNLFK